MLEVTTSLQQATHSLQLYLTPRHYVGSDLARMGSQPYRHTTLRGPLSSAPLHPPRAATTPRQRPLNSSTLPFLQPTSLNPSAAPFLPAVSRVASKQPSLASAVSSEAHGAMPADPQGVLLLPCTCYFGMALVKTEVEDCWTYEFFGLSVEL